MDFRNVTNKFADPKFDGEPVQIYTIKETQEVIEQETKEQKLEDGERILVSPSIAYSEEEENVRKYYVKETEVKVINERVQYHDPKGKLITESLTDYTKKNLNKEFRTLNEFIQKWNIVDQKKAIIEELENQGLLLDALGLAQK